MFLTITIESPWHERHGDSSMGDEEKAAAIDGAFLLPKSDATWELGIRRSAITRDI